MNYQQFNNMQNAQAQQMMMQQYMQMQAAQAQAAQAGNSTQNGQVQNNGQRSNFTPTPVNPRNVNRQNKHATINRNIFLSGYGSYQMCPYFQSVRVKYQKDFDRGNAGSICKVLVQHSHPLDIVGTLSNKGLSELKVRKPYPVIINPMYREFNGKNSKSDDSMADENMILRTNFAFVIQRQEGLFPVSSDSEVVYSNQITVIRDQFYNEIPHEQLYRTGVITITPQRPDLIEKVTHDGDRYEKNKILASKHLLKFQTQMEAAFQVAAKGGHNSVVVTLFDQEYGIPVDDQIMIYNYCILKYGHLFNAIIFGIPPYQPKDLAEYLDEQLTKPQRIAVDVEMRVAEEMMNKTYESRFDKGDKDSDDDSEPRSKGKSVSAMTDSEKMEYMKRKVKSKKKEMKARAEKHSKKSRRSKSRSKRRR